MLGIRLAELHPIFVHFPIALLLTSVALDFVATFMRRWNIADVSTWLLVPGVIGAFLAGVTGTISSHSANAFKDGATNLLALHQKFGFAAGALFAALLLARLIRLSPRILGGMSTSFGFIRPLETRLRTVIPAVFAKPPSALVIAAYLLASVVAAVLLGITGYLGGAMVYDHGLGTPTGFFFHG